MTPARGAAGDGAAGIVDATARRLPSELAGAVRRLRGTRFVGLAAEIAFFVGAGLAPFAVAVMALAGILSPLTGDAVRELEGSLGAYLVLHLEHGSELMAIGALRRLLGGSPSLLLVPLAVATFLAARGFTGATRGLARLYGNEGTRPVWRDAIATLGFTVAAELIGAVAGVTALFLPGGRDDVASTAMRWGRWLVIPAVVGLFLAGLYRHAEGGRASLRGHVLGSLVGTGGMVAAGIGYGVYLRMSPTLGMGALLGPVAGGIVATFSFVFALAVALLLGGAVNVEHGARVGSGPALHEEAGEAFEG